MTKFTIERRLSYKKPDIIGLTGNGRYYYNYDIKEETVEHNGKSQSHYSYVKITLDNKPTYEKCVETIIRKYIDQSQEFDLINSANKDILANNIDSKAVENYIEYLALLDVIKEKVKTDFEFIKSINNA